MKKSFISIGLLSVFAISALGAMAETTIYRDGIGRMHFLGKDPASNTKTTNYTNPQAQDLTRKLYENNSSEVNYDTNFDQHPLKNYENTFSDSRFTNWRKKYESNVDEARVNSENRAKGSFTAEKGVSEVGTYNNSNTNFVDMNDEKGVRNIIDNSKKKKEKRKKKNK